MVCLLTPLPFLRPFLSSPGPDYDDTALHALCEGFGSITRAFILRDPKSGGSKGYGFVDFLTNAQADKARKALAHNVVNVRAETC